METPKNRPDDWRIEVTKGSHDAKIFAPSSGEYIARIYSRASGHADAPSDKTALGHAALFRAAPRLRESLEAILNASEERLDPLAMKSARDLLKEISAGPGEAFFEARAEDQRAFEESIQAQILEMSMQSKLRWPKEELDEDEEPGHSF